MAKAQRKFWHGVLLVVLVFGIGVGAHFSTGSVSAQDALQLDLPADSASGDSVRPLESGAKNFSNGIDLGNPLPSGSPGSANQPVATFSGLNAPWWVNAAGPVEVPDDSIFHGLVDVRRGLINNGPLFGVGNAPGNNGTLTIAEDAANPNSDIAASPGDTNVDLGSFFLTLTGRTSVTVSKFIFTKSGFAPDNNIARLELLAGDIIGGATIGTTNTSSAGVFTIAPSSQVNIFSSQGSQKFQLLGDINAAAAVGGDFTLALTALETKDASGNKLTINVNGSNFMLRKITLVAQPKPDLTVDSASQSVAPSNPAVGNAATFTANVKNSGAANAAMDAIKSKFCINLGNDVGTTCDISATFNHSGTLASNTTVAAAFAWTPDATQTGNHSFTICTDSTEALAESKDGNNCSAAKAFSVAAAGATVTFTRNPVPLATEVIRAGAKIPILLFDGKASSGTSRLTKLYVEPTLGVGAPTLANYILQRNAGGTWRDLAVAAAPSNVGSAAVPRFVLLFNIGSGTTNSDISTSNVNFRVLADVTCANVTSSIDFLVRRDTDALFTTAPTVARIGFASSVIRNIEMCGAGGFDPLSGLSNPLMNSVLDSGMYGASVLGSDSFGTFNFFGDTAKLAQASTLLEMAVPATSGNVLKNPVTIYDDLYIHGAGTAEEPGDIIIEGAIYAGGTGSLNIESSTQINGDLLRVLGTVEADYLTVSRDITASGNILARSFGQYYRVTNSTSSTSTAGTKSATASCDAAGPEDGDTNDILISCGGRFTDATNTAFAGTYMSDVTCTVYGTQSIASSRVLQAQAVCLNPDGDNEAALTGNPIESLPPQNDQ